MVKYTTSAGQTKHIPGFAVRDTRRIATQISQFETIERLVGTYTFQQDIVGNGEWYEATIWGGSEMTTIHYEDVILRGGNAPSNVGNNASGLAYHHSRDDAERHAVLELVERDLLCRIWWLKESLIEFDSESLDGSFELSFYRLYRSDEYPFVLATIVSETEPVWVCGSSVDVSIEDARWHARNEAAMMLQNHLRDKTRDFEPEEIPQKIERSRSISSPVAHDRRVHVESKVEKTAKSNLTSSWSVAELVEESPLHPDDVWIVSMWEDDDQFVVRALCDSALKLREMRNDPPSEDIPSDAFL